LGEYPLLTSLIIYGGFIPKLKDLIPL